jgi:TatD DNase family protein
MERAHGVKFVDTHAHLPLLKHADRDAILKRASEAGVEKMVTVATELSNWEESAACAAAIPSVFYTLGTHPHQADQWPESEKRLELLFEKGVPLKCVGIGETGLDFHYDFASREDQFIALEGQLRFAKRWDLPVVVHCREAFNDVFDLVKRVGLSSRGGVMHCFTGQTPDAMAAVDLGFKISFSGILTFRNADTLRDAAKALPLGEIVLETDCPFLTPQPHRGKPNEPYYLPHTATVLASVQGVSLESVAESTSRNAENLFLI